MIKLKDTPKRKKFTLKEDFLLVKYFSLYNMDWDKVAEKIENRSPSMIKNRYYALKKENDNKIEKLQNYIYNFEIEAGEEIDTIDENRLLEEYNTSILFDNTKSDEKKSPSSILEDTNQI